MVYKKRLDPDYQEFRRKVLLRDNKMCQMPYCKAKKGLVVHHIQSYANCVHLRTDPNNGICLCKDCHRLTFGKEQYYAPLFLSIIRINESDKEIRNKSRVRKRRRS